MKTTKTEHWSAALVRVGNLAVREAQSRNRQLGIPNWYSLNGRLVSDALPPSAGCSPVIQHQPRANTA